MADPDLTDGISEVDSAEFQAIEALSERLETRLAKARSEVEALRAEKGRLRDMIKRAKAAAYSTEVAYREAERTREAIRLKGEELVRCQRELQSVAELSPVVRLPRSKMATARYFIDKAAIPVSIESQAGIYFLLHDADIVYVGQSVDVPSRIRSHCNDARTYAPEYAKRFNRWCYLPCKVDDLTEIEDMFIRVFQPRYNKTLALGRHRPLIEAAANDPVDVDAGVA